MSKHEINKLKTDAQVLRYCGFDARADYKAGVIRVRDMDADGLAVLIGRGYKVASA